MRPLMRFSKKTPHTTHRFDSDPTSGKFTTTTTETIPSSSSSPPSQAPGQVDSQVSFISNGPSAVILRNSLNMDREDSLRDLEALLTVPIARLKIGSFENQDISTAQEIMPSATDPSPAVLHPKADATRDPMNVNLTGRPRASFFKKARNFFMYRPMLGEIIQINHRRPTVLKEMHEYIIPGAEYDSAARDTPPRCHPDTRIQILEDIQSHIHDPDLETRMIWIHGSLGVGKSAIMQTLAEVESSRSATFTTLFFSRPNERDDPKKAFTTLAYGLAVLNSEYQGYIGEKLQQDPMFLAKSMDEQFQRLFVTPFVENRVSFGSEPWFVFLDGLDECRGEKEQCRILDLVRNSVLHHAATTPFVWIIASRPEAHLKPPFSKANTDLGTFWELEVPLNSDESSRDVRRYLRSQFSDISENYANSLPKPWPSDRDFSKISRASSGLFVFASTLVEYLLGGDPASRLKHILAVIEKSRIQTIDIKQNPFLMLDLLYHQIMSDVPEEILSITKHLLGFYLLEVALTSDRKPVSLLVASNILEMDQHTTYAAVRKLHSVLACPPPDEAEYRPIRFYHASFPDFLSDASRSQAYHVDLSEEITHVWRCLTRILRQYGMNHACSGLDLCWLPTDHLQSMRILLLGSVQRRWAKALVEFLATAASSDSNDVRLLIDPPFLTDVFRELGPIVFFGTEDLMHSVDIFTWLDHMAPDELRQCFVVETLPLKELDLDRLFKSLCAQRWCWTWRGSPSGLRFNAVDLSSMGGFTAAQWTQAKEALWTSSSQLGELAQAQDGIVRVVGFEPAEYYIIVGPISDISGTRIHYILPYAG